MKCSRFSMVTIALLLALFAHGNRTRAAKIYVLIAADVSPQGEVIEKILRHCGLWRARAPRPPPDVEGLVHDLDGCFSDSPTGSCDQAGELTFVDMDTFLATF